MFEAERQYLSLPKGEQYEKERHRMLALIRQMDMIACEQVFIPALDGTRLAARYYHIRDGAPLQIQFRGYRSSALRDFCDGNQLARAAGHHTPVPDL